MVSVLPSSLAGRRFPIAHSQAYHGGASKV